jgi:hypothetical protein
MAGSIKNKRKPRKQKLKKTKEKKLTKKELAYLEDLRQREEKGELTIEELKQSAWSLKDEVIQKLEEAFKYDFTVAEACTHAKISIETYYNWREKSKEFLNKMEDAKNFLAMNAKTNVTLAIVRDKSVADSWEFLKRRQKKLYSDRSEITGENGEAIQFNIINFSQINEKKQNTEENKHKEE